LRLRGQFAGQRMEAAAHRRTSIRAKRAGWLKR
jgi:hypothetical protein